ncbi:hypothetical protein BGZ75_003910 [Mortierella antarctica]|nr:hypothetical protein BGZ75_003910 [Mortierella antarctica]
MIAASHQTILAVQDHYHGVLTTQDSLYQLHEVPLPRTMEQGHKCSDDDGKTQDLSCLRRSSTAKENSEDGSVSSIISAHASELSSSPYSSSPSPSSCSSPSLRPTLASSAGSQSERLVAMREILDRLQAHQEEPETDDIDELSLSDGSQADHDVLPTLNPEILKDALGQRSLRQHHGDANLHH